MRRAAGLLSLVIVLGAAAGRAQDPSQAPPPSTASEHEQLEAAVE